MLSDEEIIQLIQKGEIDQFQRLVERYNQPILNLCFRYLGNREDAHDAAQDIFLKAFQHLFRWSPRAKFFTWLYRIAINHCQNQLRYRKLRQWFSLSDNGPFDVQDLPDSSLLNQSSLEREEEEAAIQQTLSRLSNKDRQVLILFYFLDLSYQEIAEILAISLPAVEARLFRARKNFAAQYLKLMGKPPPSK